MVPTLVCYSVDVKCIALCVQSIEHKILVGGFASSYEFVHL